MKSFLGGVSMLVGVACLFLFSLLLVHPVSETQESTLAFLSGHEVSLPFSVQGVDHMRDVASIMDGVRVLGAVSIILSLLLFSSASSRIGGWLLIIVPAALAALPWDAVFVGVHDVLFPQGGWLFPPGSPIIETYPMSFFIGFAASWAALCMVSGVLLLRAGHQTGPA